MAQIEGAGTFTANVNGGGAKTVYRVKELDFDPSNKLIDITGLDSTAPAGNSAVNVPTVARRAGINDFKMKVTIFWDDSASGGLTATDILPGASAVLVFQPQAGGTSVGKLLTANGICSNPKLNNVTAEGVVTYDVTFEGNGSGWYYS